MCKIFKVRMYAINCTSHPSWVRGLKLLIYRIRNKSLEVAPFVGVWIEIYNLTNSRTSWS